jgi:hypothetical protein
MYHDLASREMNRGQIEFARGFFLLKIGHHKKNRGMGK